MRAKSTPGWIARPDGVRGNAMTSLSLRAGRLAVELAPQAGGSIARFRHDDADLLRPMTAEAIASGRGNEAACYPLVPFSNRIANGRLVFDGQAFKLEPNWPGVRHPMHGEGWARAWDVARHDGQGAELVHEHDGEEGLAVPLSGTAVVPSRRGRTDGSYGDRESREPAGTGRAWPASLLHARRRTQSLPSARPPCGWATRRCCRPNVSPCRRSGTIPDRARSSPVSTIASRLGTDGPSSPGRAAA